MDDTPSIPGRRLPWDSICLGLIVFIAFLVRYVALDLPGLIQDETIALVAAEHSPLYILKRAMLTDAHPPYFYLFVKALLYLGHSDFALHMLPAAAGVLSVYLVHGLARRFMNEETSLLAAGLMAAYPLHALITRTLRPHPFIVCLTILAATWLIDFLRTPNRRNLLAIVVANVVLLLFHFNTILIVGTEMACALAVLSFGTRSGKTKPLLAFLGISTVSLLLDVPFLFMRLGNFPGFDLNLSMAWTFNRTLANLNRMLAVFPDPKPNPSGWVILCAGLVLLYRSQRDAALYLLAFIVLPLLALIAAKYGLFYEPWHIAFIIPFLLIVCARGLAGILIRPGLVRLAAVVFPCVLATVLFTTRHDYLYTESSSIFDREECHKPLGKILPRHLSDRGAVLFNESFERNFANWYIRQFTDQDLNSNWITSDDPFTPVTLVSVGPIYSDAEHPQEVLKQAEKLLADFGHPTSKDTLSCATITSWRLKRSPGFVMSALPFRETFSAYAPDFLRKVLSARDVQILISPLNHSIAPAAYATPGEFTARYVNRTGATGMIFRLELDVHSAGTGNRLDVFCSFDDQPPQRVFSLPEGFHGEGADIHMVRPKPFDHLDVTVRIVESDANVSFFGVSDAVGFNQMRLSAWVQDPHFDPQVAVIAHNLLDVETAKKGRYRWGAGPESTLHFKLPRSTPMHMDLECNNPIPGQTLEIIANGVPLKKVGPLPTQPWLEETTPVSVDFEGHPGENTVVLKYGFYNHYGKDYPEATFAPGDGRRLAMAFTNLTLVPQGAQEDDSWISTAP